ncbi:FeoB-associated Cys-rich membrane protein [Ectobacillus polymachus]
MINIIFGVIIFGYAGYSLYKYMKKSKQGKCATCELNQSCKSSCHKNEQK